MNSASKLSDTSADRPSTIRKLQGLLPNAMSYILLIVYALICLYPFLWMVSASVKSNQEVSGEPVADFPAIKP